MEIENRIEEIDKIVKRVDIMMSHFDKVQTFTQNVAFLAAWERMFDKLNEITDNFENQDIPIFSRGQALIASNRLNSMAFKMQNKWQDRVDGVSC